MQDESGQINKCKQKNGKAEWWRLHLCVFNYLPGQILLHIVSGNEDPAFEPPTLQLQVLPLSPQQVGLLLRLINKNILILN